MNELFNLHGKTALVTGANTGLGQGLALGLAAAGANLCLLGRTQPTETLEKLQKFGVKTHVICSDLGVEHNFNALIDELVSALGGLDILINNAGTIIRNHALDFTEDQWDSVLNLNLRSVFLLSQAVARYFVARNQPGKIINIASMLSFQGGIRVPAYTASKSALAGLTKALANEWAEQRINVNAIAPGYFATNNTAALQEDPVRSREILARIPAGRWGQAEDLVGAAVFLASEASNYVQGITLPVDGGWLAR